VVEALNAIYEVQEQYDCVVIIRGGGATSDLSGFDTLALAENVANFPLPIITGIGSVLYCCSYPQATPTMGSMLGLKAFVAAVLGGIGSIPGAMIGGIAIGLCECFVSAIGLSAWKDAVTFAILIIVLLVKPTGFLGRKVQEKV
jgi:ABC-type xylose transport system permease subunit